MVTTLIILGIIVVLISALLLYASTKPDAFRVERSATINAPPERIFALINDFHHWPQWSPWEKLDPAMNKTHTGAPSGQGAIYEWEGNKKVGKGRMEIMESAPSSKIVIKLDFFKPFEAHNTAEFTLQAQGNSTHINWAMLGQMPFLFKVMTTFMNMDKMIGKDFETGLANLKAIAEKGA
jgi:uncharacterized protein YndB with AHSA1/START domain